MYVISVSKVSEVVYCFLVYVPSRKDVVNVSFPNEWFVKALVDDISLNFHHKDVSKVLPFCSHLSSVSLEMVFPVKMERIVFQDNS